MKFRRDIVGYGHIDNKKMHPHCNPGMELVLTEEGDLNWAVEGRAERVPPGTIFFTLPWQVHGSCDIHEPSCRIYWLLFSLPGVGMNHPAPLVFPDVLAFTPTQTKKLNTIFRSARRHAWVASPLIKSLFPEIIDRLEAGNEDDDRIAVQLWKTLVLELAKIIESGQEHPKWQSPTVRKVQKLIQDINANIEENWSLEEMAAQCKIGRTHLNNLFNELTGYAPRQYLTLIRFERALKQLRETQKSITEIAFASGFNSSQYFTESFKDRTGLTPSEYRRQAKSIEEKVKASWKNPDRRTIEAEQRRFEELWGIHDIDKRTKHPTGGAMKIAG